MAKLIKLAKQKTWKERIMAASTGRNSRGAFLWYSHNKICEIINEQEGNNAKRGYRSLSVYLTGLVKSGHLERALKPHTMRSGVRGLSSIPEYVYRQTGKLYKRGIPALSSSKNEHTDAALISAQGHEIWRVHKTLPKWFRRMMLD